MKKPKSPYVPPEKHETVRQHIISALTGQTLSGKEISAVVKIPEKQVYSHLEHIQKSLDKGDRVFTVTPAECLKCGFVFKKREKLKTPGRCPLCHNEHIQESLYSIQQ